MFRSGWSAAAVIVLAAACSSPEVSLESQPVDLASARNLAQTVARKADCGAFEDFDFKPGQYAVFTCQLPGQDAPSFAIWTFLNNAAKEKAIGTLTASEGSLKIGPFYAVVQSHAPGMVMSEKAYAGFPGNLWRSPGTR